MPTNPIYCAIDNADLGLASALAESIAPHIGGLKLGLEFFCAQGPAGVREMARHGLPIFLDLKLHDIPNTVAKAIEALGDLPLTLLTLHASGGPEMLRRAAEAARKLPSRPKTIAVTVLTSMDAADLAAVGQPAELESHVVRLAKLTQDSGVDGVVCSPHEIAAIRQACGPDFHLVVPGIRAQAAGDDQKRTLSASEALRLGASTLVIGRPITQAADPAAAAQALAASL